MTIHFIIILIILIFFSLFISYTTIYNRFQDYVIKINEVESKIDEALRNKYDNIISLNNNIKEKIKTTKNLVDNLNEIKTDKISSFEMDRLLINALNKINFVIDKYNDFDNDQDIIKLLFEIEEIDESLKAFKNYYNENITKYNKLIRIFPYNIIGKILKYNEKTFFDGKNMNDDDENDFKI